MKDIKTLAKWSALFGLAIGLFSLWGFPGLLSLILLIAAWCVIAEWRNKIEAEAWALRAHEAIGREVDRIIKENRRK